MYSLIFHCRFHTLTLQTIEHLCQFKTLVFSINVFLKQGPLYYQFNVRPYKTQCKEILRNHIKKNKKPY